MLDDFERRFKGETNSKKLPLASHVLVLMVRSIFGTIKAPIAYFATCELKGHDLFPIVWQCIRHLELFSIRVRAIIADGASPNRKFFKLHETVTDDGLTYYTQNPFRERERIYFFCDVPHLLKTTRNNWENSGCNSKSRMLRWLEDDFLGFLSEWNTEAQEATDVPKKERHKLFLSRETYAGHQITDPLEEYFSKQRGCGGRNENPTVEQFGHNALSLMVASSKAISSLRSNCRKRPREEEADCL
ncbi:hypothetical protein BSL78_27545 [Apostichopus japonicus]|uniref:Transposable element P transposase-like RNase H domain-containing protein n=1 Tax=Stichopus japonicus TaxID=307972 RepID=A0A2G8JIQ9_STIJA|nr:hypothetical protein BSL78_27545 [Apostichopus japonicus]